MGDEQGTPTVIVGVVPGQPSAVVTAAARFADRFDAELVCASVDASRYTVVRRADGTVVAMPIDSDATEEIVEEFAPELRAMISHALEGSGVRWSVRMLAGGPAQELANLAEQLDAAMIVVGTREPGIRGSLHEFINGSVAVQLAHRQHRPVVVIPLNPVGADGALPWTDES